MAQGRGRLSKIDQWPAEAEHLIDWVLEQLEERKLTQTAILEMLNQKILELNESGELDKPIDLVSRSGFHRYSFRAAKNQRRIRESQLIVNALYKDLEPKEQAKKDKVLVEFLKTLSLEIVSSSADGKLTPKNALELANAYRAIVQAETSSNKLRQEYEREFSAKTEEVISQASKSAGLNADQIAQLRREFLGVRS